jgi:uncharacterized protein (DUF1697 family)
MNTYISILRGVNVSGHMMIKMDDLRQLYADLGFINVRTYIQSGNVIFQSSVTMPKELEMKIETQILNKYSFKIPVIVKAINELNGIVNNNPFLADKSKDESFLHVTFLSTEPDRLSVGKILEVHFPDEEFVISGSSIYLYCPKGYGKTKLSNKYFENKLKVIATTRNWKTTKMLLKMAEELN